MHGDAKATEMAEAAIRELAMILPLCAVLGWRHTVSRCVYLLISGKCGLPGAVIPSFGVSKCGNGVDSYTDSTMTVRT